MSDHFKAKHYKDCHKEVVVMLHNADWTCDMSNGNCIVHHGNAPAHTLHLFQSFLAKHNILLVHQATSLLTWFLVVFDCSQARMLLKGSQFES